MPPAAGRGLVKWGRGVEHCASKGSLGDFPGSPVAKTPHSQCRGPRFDSGVGELDPGMVQLRPSAAK